jgi:hypothetical protein
MKEILKLIAQKKVEHSKLAFYEFLRDTKVSPRDRMAFAPCFAFFVMSFSEFNRFVLREEPTTDEIQALINHHTYEDEDHWIWFLEDIRKLGLDVPSCFTETMRFLWSDETMVQRSVVRWMFQTGAQAKPVHRLVLVEAIENVADVFLATTKPVAEELKILDQQDCRYFGDLHSISDAGHTMYSKEMEKFIGSIPLTVEEHTEAVRLVHETFDVFADLMSDLLAHAKVPKMVNGSLTYTYELRTQTLRKVKPLGAYLVEAGLLTSEQLETALDEHRQTGHRLGDVLSAHAWVSTQTIEYMMEHLILPARLATLTTPWETPVKSESHLIAAH